MKADNRPWNLEAFVDALVVELDKARETLAVKAVNKAVSYTVKDMSLDVQAFPSYNGDEVQFLTAQPGEQGASKMTIQLASITDQQVRSTTKRLASKDDIKIDTMDVDEDTKKSLRKIGVTSVKDLEDLEKRNVDLEKVSPGKINYSTLANTIQKSKRSSAPPKIKKVSMTMNEGQPVLVIEGENLAVEKKYEPVAVINNELVNVIRSGSNEMHIALDRNSLSKKNNELVLTLDPYSVCRVRLKN
ncbi:MAG TPA: hypothetical protein VGC29_07645 [Flavisolibacter sp.]